MNLIDLLKIRSDTNPSGIGYRFLINDREERTLSYSQLHQGAEELANKLSRGIAAGERAILLYPAGLEFIIAFLACVAAKVIPVPLPLPKAGDSNCKLHHVIRDCSPAAILTIASQIELVTREAKSSCSIPVVSTDIADLCLAPVKKNSSGNPDIAFIQYTSGSTSRPKGVVLSHENIISNLDQIKKAFGHSEESQGVVWLPHFHDMGLIGGILEPLFANFPVTLMSPISFMQKPMRWLKAIDKYRATTSGGPNFAYEMCVAKADIPSGNELDLRCWNVAFNGAEPIRAETLRRFSEKFRKHHFSASAFLTCYGLAEATLLVTSGRPDLQSANETISSGNPQPGTAVQIMQVNRDLPSPPGEIGEITVTGPGVSSSYWGQHPAGEKVTGYRTGDLGYLSAEGLFVTGRLTDLIVVRGKNIYPEDVEFSIKDLFPELTNERAAAIGIDGVTGEELVYLQEIGARLSKKIDLGHLAQEIANCISARHDLSLKEILLLPVGRLIRTSSGKISRSATKKLYLSGRLHAFQLTMHRSI